MSLDVDGEGISQTHTPLSSSSYLIDYIKDSTKGKKYTVQK
jgi:hypothetical protein